ncbi:MAG: GNAT family N-acetyltransferase [Thermoanaerobaculia bacterium]|nr:GNAT family N-acetyltransferase [Thermoanaerobaculia bacterium]
MRRLAWDSAFFGFEVFSIADGDLTEAELRSALLESRARGASLVYWFADAGRAVSPTLLDEFGGALRDEKKVYGRSSLRGPGTALKARAEVSVRRGSDPDGPLTALALAAGEYSRFRVDPRIPSGAFQRLYETWIRRSCAGEIADAVIEAREPGIGLCGMVTVSVDGDEGSIGLIAVAAEARGRGIGAILLRGAEEFMAGKGATRARVVTQGANRPACRLYESACYDVVSQTDVYHFWLDEGADGVA